MLAPDGAFYFLEMNTRLQVEHPVTEYVLNVDLVAEQLHIAAGGGLRFTQEQLVPAGHAIECRVCAEEPEHDFRPATGRIGVLRVPGGAQVRFDGGIREGQAVTPAFDSLLAKLIGYGRSRTEAAATLAEALTRPGAARRAHQPRLPGPDPGPSGVSRRPPAHRISGTSTRRGLRPEASGADGPAASVAALLGDRDFCANAFGVPEPHASIGPWRN